MRRRALFAATVVMLPVDWRDRRRATQSATSATAGAHGSHSTNPEDFPL